MKYLKEQIVQFLKLKPNKSNLVLPHVIRRDREDFINF